MAAHVAHHAAALPHGVPKPGVVRTGMFFARADQEGGPHRLHDGPHLRADRLERLHVKLVFKIDVRQAGLFDEADHVAGLGHVPRQWLFANDSLEATPAFTACTTSST